MENAECCLVVGSSIKLCVQFEYSSVTAIQLSSDWLPLLFSSHGSTLQNKNTEKKTWKYSKILYEIHPGDNLSQLSVSHLFSIAIALVILEEKSRCLNAYQPCSTWIPTPNVPEHYNLISVAFGLEANPLKMVTQHLVLLCKVKLHHKKTIS